MELKISAQYLDILRVHCAHLLEQTELWQMKFNFEQANGSSTLDDTNATLTTLNKLFTTSGCKDAMCEVLTEKMPIFSNLFQTNQLNEEIYNALMVADNVGCFGKNP